MGPKSLIWFQLLVTGLRFVILSKSNLDLVLNCVAMGFVVEIDETLYQTFAPTLMQECLAGLPPVEFGSVDSDNKSGQCDNTQYIDLFGIPLVKLAMLVIGVIVA